MPIQATLRFGTTSEDMERQIFAELRQQVQSKLISSIGRIQAKASVIIAEAIFHSDEFQSLHHGELWKHLGLGGPYQSLPTDIINAFMQTLKVEPITEESQNFLGGVRLVMYTIDTLNDLINHPSAQYISRNRAGVSTPIPWLEWLMKSGTERVVSEHIINTQRGYFKGSRTGGAIMVKPKDGARAGWSVPAQYAGTEEDNFLLRAITPVKQHIEFVMLGEILA